MCSPAALHACTAALEQCAGLHAVHSGQNACYSAVLRVRRAMDDLRNSITELRYYRSHLFAAGASLKQPWHPYSLQPDGTYLMSVQGPAHAH